jgi:hypothetical protein
MQPKAGNLMRESHNGQKMCMKIPPVNLIRTTRHDKEAEFFHSESLKRRRKIPAQNAVPATKANSNFMHNQLLSPLLNILPIKPPNVLKQPCLGQGPKGMKSSKEITSAQKA